MKKYQKAVRWWLRLRLQLRYGKEAVMAKIIRFYVPANYHSKAKAWTPPELRGKVIVFNPTPHRKTA